MCLLLGVYAAQAQDNSIRWFTEADGLPNKSVDDLELDERGNVIIANHLGMTIYDGRQFVVKSKKDGLPTSGVARLKRSPSGKTWIQCYSNKRCLLSADSILPISLYNDSVYNFKSQYDILLISDNEFILDMVTPHRYVHFKKNAGKWELIANVNTGVDKMPVRNPDNWKEIVAYLDYATYKNTHVITFNQANGDTFKLKSDNYEYIIYGYNCNGKSCVSVDNYLFDFGKNGIKKYVKFNQNINKIFDGIDNTLWVSFTTGGICRIDKNSLQVISQTILNTYIINNFVQDMEGGIWFGASKGLGYLPVSRFEKWRLENKFQSRINCIYFLNDTLYVGHENGDFGYIVPDVMQQEVLVYRCPYKNDYFKSGQVRKIMLNKNGEILFANSTNGVYSLNRKTFKVKQLYEGAALMFYQSADDIYVPMLKSGVMKISTDTLLQLPIDRDINNLPAIVDIIKKDTDYYLLGCRDGLWELNKGKLFYKGNHERLNEMVSGFLEINRSITAITTYGSGLVICSPTDTVVYDTKNGLVSNYINDIFPDSKGRIWLATNNGISVLEFVKKYDIKSFKIQNIPGFECVNFESIQVEEYKNKIYVVSQDGVMLIDTLYPKIKSNPLTIVHVLQNNVLIPDNNISYDYTADSNLEIKYRTNNFNPGEPVTYYYRLLNKSSKWIKTTNESVLLQGLSPGKYVFEIYSRMPYTGMKSEIRQLHINVVPRFWQYLWVKIVFALLIAGMVYLLFRNILTLVQKRERARSDMQLSLAEMKLKALRAQMNPHFTFNVINSIQHFILYKNDESAHRYLSKFSKLLRTILYNSNQQNIPIQEEVKALGLYLELESMRFEQAFDYEIKIDDAIDPENQLIPSMLIQPYVENAVKHGIMPLKEKGKILVEIYIKDNNLICSISDNGIGRVVASGKSAEGHYSMGTAITKERLSIINKLNSSELSENITDLYDAEGKACGTKVDIYIPILYNE